MNQARWLKAGAALLAIALIGGLVAALAGIGGTPASTDAGTEPPASAGATDLPTTGPTAEDLDALAAELSSGDDQRILGAIADIPVEAADQALASLGDLQSVTFDADTVRFDPPTGAALVDATLTAGDGSEQSERVVLVERLGRWLLFSTLQQPGATPIQ